MRRFFTTLFPRTITDKNKLKNLAQLNTLTSLVNLKPHGIYSLVFVDDAYWKRKALALGIDRVRPILSRNPYNTPFLHQMLKVARRISATFHCYINGDILLGLSFVETLQHVQIQMHSGIISKRVYLIGRRYNYNLGLEDSIKKTTKEAEAQMNNFIQKSALGQPDAFDYFVFSKNAIQWQSVPRFVIGRRSYDNCLTHIAVADEMVSTIDVTMTVRALHQTDKFGNHANKHFKHEDDLWNEQQCWRKDILDGYTFVNMKKLDGKDSFPQRRNLATCIKSQKFRHRNIRAAIYVACQA